RVRMQVAATAALGDRAEARRVERGDHLVASAVAEEAPFTALARERDLAAARRTEPDREHLDAALGAALGRALATAAEILAVGEEEDDLVLATAVRERRQGGLQGRAEVG